VTPEPARIGQSLLPNLAIVADVVGILGFLGLSSTRWVRVAVTATLSVIGLIAATTYLYGVLRLYLSPRGAYRAPATHRREALKAVVALVVAGVLGVAAIYAAREENSEHSKRSNVAGFRPGLTGSGDRAAALKSHALGDRLARGTAVVIRGRS
jgi:hypothetical protein